jgi:hypothetical protein
VIAVALLTVAEHLYEYLRSRHEAMNRRRIAEQRFLAVSDASAEGEELNRAWDGAREAVTCSSEQSGEEGEGSDSSESESSSLNAGTQPANVAEGPRLLSAEHGGQPRLFVAMYDFDGENDGDCLSFRAGDRLIVEGYVESEWCSAAAVGPDGVQRVGLVPGNFLRPIRQKF